MVRSCGKKVKEMDDSKIVNMVKGVNKECYEEIFERYRWRLFKYVYSLVGNREETEDIIQGVFIKVYDNIEKFDTSKKFSSWIYRIAHNEAVNHLKKKNKKYMVSWEDVSTVKDQLEISSDDNSPLENWVSKEIQEEVDSALDELPAKYKEVLLLRYFGAKSYEEIGQTINKPVNTVGTLINRAKKKLLEIAREKELSLDQ